MAKKSPNQNLLKFYWRQTDEILHACLERHKDEIREAIATKDEKRKWLYRQHQEAVKHVLETRHPL